MTCLNLNVQVSGYLQLLDTFCKRGPCHTMHGKQEDCQHSLSLKTDQLMLVKVTDTVEFCGTKYFYFSGLYFLYFIAFTNKAISIPQLSRKACPVFQQAQISCCKSQRLFVYREELEEKCFGYHVSFSIQCYTFSFPGISFIFSIILPTTNSESK